MKVLTYGVTPYTYQDVSMLNMAASKDIVIEQGASFVRYYRWMKDDGIPFDLTAFDIEFVISTTKDNGTLIACSPIDITITKSGYDTGVFSVGIAADTTRLFDFTRASYQITASWNYNTVRLIEGTVVLDRGIKKVGIPMAMSGGTTMLSSTCTKAIGKHLSAAINQSGSMHKAVHKNVGGTLPTAGTLTS